MHRFQDKPWFFVSKQQLSAAEARFNRYGRFSLLFAWLPVIGDPLTFIAGILRVPFSIFVVLVALGKALRYAIVLVIALNLISL